MSSSSLGVRLVRGGAQVSVFSHDGTKAWFCSFVAGKEIRIALTKSADVFSGFVAGIKAGDQYGFRVAGPWAPEKGQLFDETKLLVDPYATRLSNAFAYVPQLGMRGLDTASFVPKSIVEEETPDAPLRSISRPKFIYELGVKSFTKLHPDVSAAQRGTVAALANPAVIAHFKKIGVDTLELMPIHAWIDESHLPPLGLRNAWGYNSVQYFALDPRICPGGWEELRATITTLHENGLQVVLDVVYNHSGEGDLLGPTLSFRGLDNATYYAQTDGLLHNDAGTGNTLALNRPPVMEMVLASLRHAVLKAGVDGFRFDLATVLGRTDEGFDPHAPLITAIIEDPVLSSRILIAEPWDVGPGGYRLGNFPPDWLEWNDQYRDDVRRFWRGEQWSANAMATRLCGSSDIFSSRRPSASVNFVAAHDGFTLRDLTRYATKQNLANGEYNRDGNDGEVTCPETNVHALLATLFLSRGTMMMTAGDEFGRTQLGNNNAYAQDNETTWLNWTQRDKKLIEYVSYINSLRQKLDSFFEDRFVTADEAIWFGADGKALNWNDAASRILGLKLRGKSSGDLAMVFNASNDAIPFPLVPELTLSWQRIFASSEGAACPPHSVAVFQLKADSGSTAKRRK